jgi:hypothetical protein
MKKAVDPSEAVCFEQIPNIGPRIAAELRRIGFTKPGELRRRDPYAMYGDLCQATGTVVDPCVIDVFISATRFMQGEPARPWWAYTAERKATLANSTSRSSKSQKFRSGRRVRSM